MCHRRLTHTASAARPSQTPLQGCADDAAPLTPNTVALPVRERRYSGYLPTQTPLELMKAAGDTSLMGLGRRELSRRDIESWLGGASRLRWCGLLESSRAWRHSGCIPRYALRDALRSLARAVRR